ncbi:MAG: prolyl oligopeptidase family serine peptidase [Acetobacteraceae bacterium]|nr:prolyl oligopeptidase family serine peptidase [Acetobacteraceae bacterium]
MRESGRLSFSRTSVCAASAGLAAAKPGRPNIGPFLALLAWLANAQLAPEHVRIAGPGGVTLEAALVRPAGPVRAPAVVALHGCGGPFPSRDGPWAQLLSERGHIVLLPDSFGSRGLGSQCRNGHRTVTPAGLRRGDAIAAAQWLAAQPGTPPGGVTLMGWSNGGSTVLRAGQASPGLPPGLFRNLVAFYPGCRGPAANPSWSPAAALLLLIGEADDWTPAEPCRDLAARFPGRITLVTYTSAFHDFDAAEAPVRLRTGLASTADRSGFAHTGTNVGARDDARRRVPSFIEATGGPQ